MLYRRRCDACVQCESRAVKGIRESVRLSRKKKPAKEMQVGNECNGDKTGCG